MLFTVNTKPVVEGLDLGIIQSNISKLYQKSCIVELTIEDSILRINTEASAIKSELKFLGKPEGDGKTHTFVDSLLFKNLMKTIDSNTVTFDINESGLVVSSGKSNYTLPQVISEDDMELDRPMSLNPDEADKTIDLNIENWQFIKDNQLYALAMSFVHPVYRYIWMSDDQDVIVGDFDNSIFTHSYESQLSTTCLIPDTIVNLMTEIPGDSKLMQIGQNYEIMVETDPFTYVCEFTPKYESDENVGDYHSDMILSLFDSDQSTVKLDVSQISKYIGQAELFSTNADDRLNLSVNSGLFVLENENVHCEIPVNGNIMSFQASFKITMLKDFISHTDTDEIELMPLIQAGDVSGIILKTSKLEAVLASIE